MSTTQREVITLELPILVYDVLFDGRKILVARFRNTLLADDFIKYRSEVSPDSKYEVVRADVSSLDQRISDVRSRLL